MRRRIVVGSAVLAALALVLGTALASRRDNGAVRTVPIGHAPGGLLPDSRTGHIFVSNAADNTVDTIDERTGALVRAAAVDFSPPMSMLDRRTGHVLALDTAGIGVSILDADGTRLRRHVRRHCRHRRHARHARWKCRDRLAHRGGRDRCGAKCRSDGGDGRGRPWQPCLRPR